MDLHLQTQQENFAQVRQKVQLLSYQVVRLLLLALQSRTEMTQMQEHDNSIEFNNLHHELMASDSYTKLLILL